MKVISIEGLDAAGKHTAMTVLAQYFKSEGLWVETMAFPNYGTPTGDMIRSWLKGEQEFDQETFELLQAADKQAMQNLMREHEADGVDVLLIDRYVHSQWAYGAHKSDMAWLQAITKHVRMPDAVIYLDVEPEVSLHRKGKYGDNDRYEANLGILRHARETYLSILGGCPERNVQILDANQPQLLVKASLFSAAKRLAWSLSLTVEPVAAV